MVTGLKENHLVEIVSAKCSEHENYQLWLVERYHPTQDYWDILRVEWQNPENGIWTEDDYSFEVSPNDTFELVCDHGEWQEF